MLRYNQYIDNVKDKAWFDSSNVVYGECDESDTQYKTVRIVFKNGSTYQYDKVLVADWVSFKFADSQGKALIEHFKKAGYEYKRIDDANLDELNSELERKLLYDFVLKINKPTETLILFDNKNDVNKYEMACPDEIIITSIKEILESLGYKVGITTESGDEDVTESINKIRETLGYKV